MSVRSVALLRGVNVGGRSSLKMAALRDAFEALGYDDVATYIQSGNVVFTSARKVAGTQLGEALSAEVGRDLVVVVRTAAELREVLDADPFPSADRKARHIGFCDVQPSAKVLDGIDLESFEPDRVAIVGSEVHFLLPNGIGRAKLPVAVGRNLDVDITVRNWNTSAKLLEMVEG